MAKRREDINVIAKAAQALKRAGVTTDDKQARGLAGGMSADEFRVVTMKDTGRTERIYTPHEEIGPKPCPRCGENHTAAEHMSHGYGSFLRTHPNEALLGVKRRLGAMGRTEDLLGAARLIDSESKSRKGSSRGKGSKKAKGRKK